MPFEQLKQLADHLSKLQSDLLSRLEGEPYPGFSEQIRMFQDGLTQAQGEFAEEEELQRQAAEAAAEKAAAEEAASQAEANPPEEAPSAPTRPALHVPDETEEVPEEDGSVWKLDWSVMPDASSLGSGIRPPAQTPQPAPPHPKPNPDLRPKKELWDDLSDHSDPG